MNTKECLLYLKQKVDNQNTPLKSRLEILELFSKCLTKGINAIEALKEIKKLTKEIGDAWQKPT